VQPFADLEIGAPSTREVRPSPATGCCWSRAGCRAAAAGQLAVSLGHTLEPPVPSLFTFRIESPWLRSLAGISVGAVEVSVPAANYANAGRCWSRTKA